MASSRTPVAKRGDASFACTRTWLQPGEPLDRTGEPCGTTVPLHGLHWVHEVCPKCLACYAYGFGADDGLYPDFGAAFDAATRARVVANVARNGGRYVPEF